MDGFLNLNKPIGWTSRAAVDRVVRLVRPAKVGHAGTLDPLASGVLVVAIGAATRLIDRVQAMPKTYRTTVRLGARSDTLDADGRVEAVPDPTIPTEAAVRAAAARQVGEIRQVPPQYSALKVAGRRAYDLARAGREVELAARPVRIDRVEVLSYDWPRLELEIDCGGGTYIRSIARDIGEDLGCGGLVEVLTRTRIGPMSLGDAIDAGAIEPATLAARLLPPLAAVPDLPRAALSPDQLARVLRGQLLEADRLAGDLAPGGVALLAPDGSLAALGEFDPASRSVFPRKVFSSGDRS